MPNSPLDDQAASNCISNFIHANTEWFGQKARALNVPLRFILIQSLLHLPSYTERELGSDSKEVLKKLSHTLEMICKDFRTYYDLAHNKSKIDILSTESKIVGRRELTVVDGLAHLSTQFVKTNNDVGDLIQSHLHYIRSPRRDSILDCGLFLDYASFPYAYSSFCVAARDYQVSALNKAAGLNLNMKDVAIMTRAFALDGAPHNSMSKLFHRSHDMLRETHPEYKVVITALNPYLGFGGGIFTGSSYTPYALSPMEYWYDENGFYVPRRKGKHLQNIQTPPIVWLAHGLNYETASKIDQLNNQKPVHITEHEYKLG